MCVFSQVHRSTRKRPYCTNQTECVSRFQVAATTPQHPAVRSSYRLGIDPGLCSPSATRVYSQNCFEWTVPHCRLRITSVRYLCVTGEWVAITARRCPPRPACRTVSVLEHDLDLCVSRHAPLGFCASNAHTSVPAFMNDTLVSTLLIKFSVHIPATPAARAFPVRGWSCPSNRKSISSVRAFRYSSSCTTPAQRCWCDAIRRDIQRISTKLKVQELYWITRCVHCTSGALLGPYHRKPHREFVLRHLFSFPLSELQLSASLAGCVAFFLYSSAGPTSCSEFRCNAHARDVGHP